MQPSLLRHQVLLLLLASLISLTLLGQFAVFNAREASTAATAAEMARKGAWIVPTFNGDLQSDSPILIDWVLLASYGIGGINEFAARIATALLFVVTIMLTYQLARKLYSPDVAFVSALILATSLYFATEGRTATADMLLTTLVTTSLTAFVWQSTTHRGASFHRPPATSEQSQPSLLAPDSEAANVDGSVPIQSLQGRIHQLIGRGLTSSIAVYLPLGLAALTTGPAGLLIPLAAYLLFILVSQRADEIQAANLGSDTGPTWKWIFREIRHIFKLPRLIAAAQELKLASGVIVALIVAVPWYLAVAAATGGSWWYQYFIQYSWKGIYQPLNGQSGFPFWAAYPLLTLLLGFFPWTTFLPIGILRLYERLKDGAAWKESDRLLACWAGIWIVAYSLIATRTAHSLVPIYPIISILMGRYFSDWRREKKSIAAYSFIIACRIQIGLSILLAIGLAMYAYLYFPSEQWMGLIAFAPFVSGIVGIKLLDQDRRQHAITALMTAACIFTFLLVSIGSSRLGPYQDTPLFLAEARRSAGQSDVHIGTFDYFEPSVVFYAGRDVTKLNTPRDVADFLTAHPKSFVITRATRFNELREVLPISTNPISRRRNFLHGYELILIGL